MAAQTREEEYLQIASRYEREELSEFARALAFLTNEMHEKPFQDCLGTFYTEIASKSTVDARGEFYTPPEISEVMTRMLIDVDKVIEEGKPITVNEPACGSGGMILALAKQFSPVMRDDEKSYVDLLRVTMQDISPTSADMAYINTTLWGIPAKIIQGDTLRMTVDHVWRNIHWARVGETANENLQAVMRQFRAVMETVESPPEQSPQEDRDPVAQAEFGPRYYWDWEDAFLKYGFGDGDDIHTGEVASFLQEEGYAVVFDEWGAHNEVISSIQKGGRELMPDEKTISFGYDSPRDYLPREIIEILDGRMKTSRESSRDRITPSSRSGTVDDQGQFELGLDA